MFRLHIDFPLGEDEEKAAEASKMIAHFLENGLTIFQYAGLSVSMFQYRLADDSDRAIKNYLIKDENNHVANRKIKVEL